MDSNKKGDGQEKVGMPGSLVLALLFLAFFGLMLAVNYRLLGQAWPIR